MPASMTPRAAQSLAELGYAAKVLRAGGYDGADYLDAVHNALSGADLTDVDAVRIDGVVRAVEYGGPHGIAVAGELLAAIARPGPHPARRLLDAASLYAGDPTVLAEERVAVLIEAATLAAEHAVITGQAAAALLHVEDACVEARSGRELDEARHHLRLAAVELRLAATLGGGR